MADADALLRAQLGGEQRTLLDRAQDAGDEVHCLCLQEMFRYGFTLGARLMLEALTSPGSEAPGA